jgi:hypothetical protein
LSDSAETSATIHQQQEDDATIEYGAKIIQAASKEQDREIDQER